MKLNNVLSKLGVVILLSMNISFTAFIISLSMAIKW